MSAPSLTIYERHTLKQKTSIELQKQRISLIVRAQASIVRAEYLNEVLPVALKEFDRRVQAGDAYEVGPVNLNALVEVAAAQVIG